MSEQNMNAVRQLLEEVWTHGNLALLPEIMAEDAVAYPMPHFGVVQGRKEYTHFIAVYKGVFHDMRFSIEDQFACDHKVATRWISRVTDAAGDAQQNAESGEEIVIEGTTITHHDDAGKIVAEWGNWDTQSLMHSAAAPKVFEQLSMKA